MQANQKGIIMSTTDLVLQGITRNQAGNYSCVASNVEGDGDSNIVVLKVMYKPVCRPDQKKIYGVARHERVDVLCEVDSYPPPDSFKWTFNNSEETTDVSSARYHSGGQHFISTLTYTPVSELDYGTVMCWANNLPGKQVEACVYHIIPAGKPDAPHNCSIMNMTNDSLEVECSDGFDGGQPQYFLLEVYDSSTGVLQANVSSKFPEFIVSGLDPGKSLKMIVYAANAKGRSDSVMLDGFTLNVAEKQSVLSLDTRDRLDLAPILGILVGVVTALLLVGVVTLGALKIRAARGGNSRMLRPGFLPIKDKGNASMRSDSDFDKDDKNPDIIPSNKDSDYQLGSAAQTLSLNNSAASAAVTPAPMTAPSTWAAAAPSTAAPSPPPRSPLQAAAAVAAMQQRQPLQEAYGVARDRGYQSPSYSSTPSEVTYAELSIVRPNTLDTSKGTNHYAGGTVPPYRDDSTVYAQIDHSRRAPPPAGGAVRPSPIVSPASAIFPPPVRPGYYHREVVTVRTPLMGAQESCV